MPDILGRFILNTILVSVIIPIFNTEKYLRECLDSVLAQSYSNMEIICVNDASTDGSMAILKEYSKSDSRLIVISHQEALGPATARNKGLDIAKGKYVLFVDSDDYIAPNLLKETVICAEDNRLEELHFNYAVVTNKEWGWQARSIVSEEGTYYCYKSGGEMLIKSKSSDPRDNTVATVWSCLFNRKYLNNNKLRFYDGILHEDLLFFFRRCICVKNVAKLNRIYYFYRKREDSITTGDRGMRGQSLFTVISEIYAVWLSSNFEPDVQNAIASELEYYWFKYKQSQLSGETHPDKSNIKPAVDFMYRLTNNMVISEKNLLNQEDIDALRKKGDFILYGSGLVATKVVLYLKQFDLHPCHIMVEFHKGNPSHFAGVEVRTIEEMKGLYELPVVLGVSKGYSNRIDERLRQLGYHDIIHLNRG